MNKEKLVSIACSVIAENLGKITAENYREFYKDKDENIILASINEMLNEVVGPAQAQRQMEKIKKELK